MLSVYEDLLAALRILGRRVAPTHHLLSAGGEQLERREIAVHDRQIFYILFVELDRYVGSISLELFRLGGDFHLYAGRTKLKLTVDARRCVCRNSHVPELNHFETRSFDSHGVRIGDQMRHGIVAALVAGGLVVCAFRLICDRDLGTGNRRTRRVGNRTFDAAKNCLTGRDGRQKTAENRKSYRSGECRCPHGTSSWAPTQNRVVVVLSLQVLVQKYYWHKFH